MRRCPSLILFVLMSLAPAAALADLTASEAQERFVAAREEYEKLDYSAALRLFRDLVAQTNSPNARLYAGRCLRELGKLPEAYDELRVALRDATELVKSEPRYGLTRDAAAAEVAALEAHIGRLRIVLRSSPLGMQVTLNGAVVASERLGDASLRAEGIEIPVLPGDHEIVVSAPGKATWKQTVRADPGPPRLIEVPPLEAPRPAAPPRLSRAEPAGGGAERAAGIAVGAVGVVGIAIGSVYGVRALSKKSDGDALCSGKLCSQEGLDLHEESQDFANISNVAIGAGAGCVIAGGLLFLLAPSRATEPASSKVGFSLTTTVTGGMFTVRGVF
jgi:hypothetical protein